MARSLALGNGQMLVCLDMFGQVRDLYFPYVGLENHVGNGHVHKIGVYAEGRINWLDNGEWSVEVGTEKETLVSEIKARNDAIGIELMFSDVVYNEKPIWIRKITVKNVWDSKRTVKVFINQQFEMYATAGGDTAFFDPKKRALVHYKGRRVIVTNAMAGDTGFDEYSVGILGIEGKEGTYKDAEDGVLAKNPIEHGQVDSVIGFTLELGPYGGGEIYYWLATAKTLALAHELNEYVLSRHPRALIQTTRDYWRAWVNKQNFSYFKLELPVIELFKKSLLQVRAHMDDRGGIIASGDSNMLHHGRDTYGYVWPRDGALSALALIKAGDTSVARKFFEFCDQVITSEGYFMHKYRSDMSLGSSWHPWVRNGKYELPIQEDETALVVIVLWEYYRISKDLEFVEKVYNSLVRRATEFMVRYIQVETGLPLPSYDLWEEKFGVSTFSASTVYGALVAAAKFAKLLGKSESERLYTEEARRIKVAILKYLYREDGLFYKMVNFDSAGKIGIDETLDVSSVYGIFRFGVLEHDDPRVVAGMKLVSEKLFSRVGIGGMPRYVGDKYYQTGAGIPNPWFVTTLWWVQYQISLVKSEKDLGEVKKWLKWVAKYAQKSGAMAEQLHPLTGEPVSVSPLTWSHAELITTVIMYLERMEELGICEACYKLA